MSDLISRSKAISVLEQLNGHSLSGKMDISNAIYLLENQPTAYDVNKVVDELKEIKDTHESNIGVYCATDRAIEIVKQGGRKDVE